MLELKDEGNFLELVANGEYKTLYNGQDIDLESLDIEDFNDRVLLMRSINGDRSARNKFILGKIDYIRKIVTCDNEVKSFKARGLDDDDLFQTGVMGVLCAIDKFDFRPGVKVKTYINNNVKYSIKNAYRKYGSISVSREANSIYRICSRQMDLLEDKIDSSKILKISRETNISPSRLEYGIMAVKSRNCQYRYDNDGCLDTDLASMEKYSQKVLMNYNQEENLKFNYWLVMEAIARLEEKENLVITEIYINDKTQKEVARQLGCSTTSVGNIKRRALEKIRNMLRDVED